VPGEATTISDVSRNESDMGWSIYLRKAASIAHITAREVAKVLRFHPLERV
jgi:hypothetical protein